MTMDKYIESFPEQLLQALKLCSDFTLPFSNRFESIIVCGMGGSAIGAELVKGILGDSIPIIYYINKTYTIPAFTNDKTLIIFSSYSGDTEETLAAFSDALNRNCTKVCITSGGELYKLAQQNNIPVILLPGGMPPRTCTGYSMVAIFTVLNRANIIADSYQAEITAAADYLLENQDNICTAAKTYANILAQSIPVIYTSDSMYAIGLRWKQQINENAKMHCFQNVIPEMHHNELVAFSEPQPGIIPVFVINPNEKNPAVIHRIKKSIALLQDHGTASLIIEGQGNSETERILFLLHLGDWISLYLARLYAVDPIDITMLNTLKSLLKNKES